MSSKKFSSTRMRGAPIVLTKAARALPSLPKTRYNIFSGTNTWAEWRYVLNAFVSKDVSLQDGPEIAEYESEFARITGTRYAFSFASGRMALYTILEALGVGKGDEVIIPAFTCVVVPNAILYRGATPIYVDIDPRTFNIDVSKVATAITKNTKVLYAQHTFGLVCDVDALNELGQKYGIPVIEDASLALGAMHKGQRVGGLTQVAFFSTDHSKVISTSTGGMVTTNDHDLAERLNELSARTPFLSKKQIRKIMRTFLLEFILFHPRVLWIGKAIHTVLGRLGFWFYFYDTMKTSKPTEYPYPARLSSIQAAIGLSQLTSLRHNIAHRRRIGMALEELIGWNAGLLEPKAENHVFLRYSILVRDRRMFERMFASRFDLGIWFTSIAAGRSENLNLIGYRMGSCPIAEKVAQHVVNWPTHTRIPPETLLQMTRKHLPRIKQIIIDPTEMMG